MSYYYRKPNKDNYEDDIRNLNNKIDIVYTSLENIIQDRNDLLIFKMIFRTPKIAAIRK